MTKQRVFIEMPEPRISCRITAVLDEIVGHKRPDVSLWHYTTLSGLYGIVNSRVLWASDLGFLEDPEEMRYGSDFIREEARRRGEKRGTEDLEQRVWSLIESAATIGMACSEQAHSRFFSFSLSEADDLLSQWRAYAPARDGAALRIGLKAFLELASRSHFELLKCCYDTSLQLQLIERLLHKVLQEAHLADPSYLTDGSAESSAWNRWIVPGTMVLAAMFKREKFSEEREWRVAKGAQALSWPETKYRLRKDEMIPYIELPLAAEGQALPIDHVRIGPGPEQEVRKLAVTGLIAQATKGNGKLDQSQITLRRLGNEA